MRLAHAKRRDDNEKAIVAELRSLGMSVLQTDEIDLVLGYRGLTYCYEIKNPKTCFLADGITFKKGAIKESQVKLMATWLGHYKVVWSVEQILFDIGYKK